MQVTLATAIERWTKMTSYSSSLIAIPVQFENIYAVGDVFTYKDFFLFI